ncbi:MAG: hypothetical protein ACO29Y_06145, partial [Holophagaceae bacterium]
VAAVTNRIHSRINRVHERINGMDQRIDTFEVKIVSNFVAKHDFERALTKIDMGMNRLDEKLDRILMRHD